jgi:integrase
VFLKWAEKVDAVTEGLHSKILMPKLKSDENQRDKKIDPSVAFDIIDHLRKYSYASDSHVIFELMWHTAARLGGIHSLDVEDYHPNESYIEFNHRPDSGTTLKNGKTGERPVALNDEVCEILDDYIATNRYDVKGSNGRDPLITSENGRLCKSIIRRRIYNITQPCSYNAGCPDSKDKLDCEYYGNGDLSGSCPFNLNPHAIRRGSLTYHLLRDWSKEDTGERADVTPDILEKHYDRRTDKEKLDRRRENVRKL